MDQDFHYYGTYYAAMMSGAFSATEATLIAKASNFIDFLNEGTYGGYWILVRDKKKAAAKADYKVVAKLNSPRYTFQAGKLSTGVGAEDGLWCSYHFTPGNYPEVADTPTPEQNHGAAVASRLPTPPEGNAGRYHTVRAVKSSVPANIGKLLNRPLSPLSRAMFHDTVHCATDDARLEEILARSIGGWELLRTGARQENLARFRLILLGVRAHVLADTWAHQDFSGVSHAINTYYDIAGSWGRQAIEYQDMGDEWKSVVLKCTNHENLQAVPNGTSYLGHGWMGHFPDYSFVKFRYKPCWRDENATPLERNNPEQYRYAFLELCSLFARAGNAMFNPATANTNRMEGAFGAIKKPCEIADKAVCPRQHSSEWWLTAMRIVGIEKPGTIINAKLEPDEGAVLDGLLESSMSTSTSRYGDYYVHASSDLYLFQIAADYHFQFISHYLRTRGIMNFTGSWSTQPGPVAPLISDIFPT